MSRRLDGEPVTVAEYGGSSVAAEALAGFVVALHRFPVGPDGPAPRPLGLFDRDAASGSGSAGSATPSTLLT